MKKLVAGIILLGSSHAFGCGQVANNLFNHAKVDAPYTFSKYADVDQTWVRNYRANCTVDGDKTEVLIWMGPTQHATVEFMKSFDRCSVIFNYEKGKLVSKVPGCA
ncbi:MAG: hypothetical protein CME64_00015 [Halobacteriovoraceae bacterium]|nr:hypothetical protein [Halobacteriovoraceae bacterium]|tara:strand:- start:1278 stop:1595 length:318 start_codon:yes stop_codon:yes gene_type:complete